MKVVYTLAGSYYQPTDIELALQGVEATAKQLGKKARILLETKQQYPVLNGVNNLAVKGNSFTFRSIQGSIETRLQYKGAKGDIIITACPSIQLLQKLQDSDVSVLFVVPEMTASPDIYHWLDLYSAMDIQSRQRLQDINIPDSGVRRAVGYLKDYCKRMTVDLTHTAVNTGELADVANTLKKQGITANYEEVLKYCLQRDLSYAEGCIIAKAFSQQSMLKKRGTPNFQAYWNMINDPKWDQIP